MPVLAVGMSIAPTVKKTVRAGNAGRVGCARYALCGGRPRS
jgi:hypothetical protein